MCANGIFSSVEGQDENGNEFKCKQLSTDKSAEDEKKLKLNYPDHDRTADAAEIGDKSLRPPKDFAVK